MKFTFEYDIGNTETVELTISDALVARAQTMGLDLVSTESFARHAIDRFVDTIIYADFWQRAKSDFTK